MQSIELGGKDELSNAPAHESTLTEWMTPADVEAVGVRRGSQRRGESTPPKV